MSKKNKPAGSKGGRPASRPGGKMPTFKSPNLSRRPPRQPGR